MISRSWTEFSCSPLYLFKHIYGVLCMWCCTTKLCVTGDVLLFFKLYDPKTTCISYCGHAYMPITDKICKSSHICLLLSCSSSWFPFVGVRPVIRHLLSLLFSPLLPVGFFCTFLPPLPSSDLSSHNLPISAVIFLVFCYILVSLSQIFSVFSELSFWPCTMIISNRRHTYMPITDKIGKSSDLPLSTCSWSIHWLAYCHCIIHCLLVLFQVTSCYRCCVSEQASLEAPSCCYMRSDLLPSYTLVLTQPPPPQYETPHGKDRSCYNPGRFGSRLDWDMVTIIIFTRICIYIYLYFLVYI